MIGERWHRALAKLGAGRYCDIVDFHLYNDRYTGYPGDIPERAIRELRDTIGSVFRHRIYMSEGQGAASPPPTRRWASISESTAIPCRGLTATTISNSLNFKSVIS